MIRWKGRYSSRRASLASNVLKQRQSWASRRPIAGTRGLFKRPVITRCQLRIYARFWRGWISLTSQREGVLAKARAELIELEKALPPSLVAVARILANMRQFREAIVVYEKASSALSHRKRTLAIRERWRKFINAATAAFCEAEASLANARIAGCEAEYQSLFNSLIRGGPEVQPNSLAGGG